MIRGHMMTVYFGTAGNSETFTQTVSKSSVQAPAWLNSIGLNAYEYQCGNGVRIGDITAQKIGKEAHDSNMRMSLHSPYYISLANLANLDKNIDYIMQSCNAAVNLGAERIVVHSGSVGGRERTEALADAKVTLLQIFKVMDESGFSEISLCPETMGKINQLGTFEEVMELCQLDERLIPCIDFGHLYARTLGGIEGYEATAYLFDHMENALGLARAKKFHSHFSKIEYTNGGERKHLTFDNPSFGPDFRPVARLVAERGYTPVFICESAGTQSEDALEMKRIYIEELNHIN